MTHGAEDRGDTARNRGMELAGRQLFEEAFDAFREAAEEYQRVGRVRAAAGAQVGMANCLSELGDLRSAAQILEGLAEALAPDDSLATTVYANLAVCLARGGAIERANETWKICYPRYLAGEQWEDAARCLHNLAMSAHERGRDIEGLGLVSRARELLHVNGDQPADAVGACDMTAGLCLLRTGSGERAIAALSAALAGFTAAGLSRGRFQALGNLAVAALESNDIDAAARHLAAATDTTDVIASRQDQTSLAIVTAALELHRHDWPAAITAAQTALGLADAHRDPLGLGEAQHLLSLAHERAGSIEQAARYARQAFDTVDAYRYTFSSLRDRHLLSITRAEPMLLHALAIAAARHDGDGLTILIERARIAGTQRSTQPIGDGDHPLNPFDRPALGATTGPFSSDLRLPVDAPPPLAMTSAAGSPGGTLVLPHLVAAMTAEESPWWWTMWSQRGHLYWSVVDRTGTIGSGRLDLSADVLDLAQALAPAPSGAETAAAAAVGDGHAERHAQLMAIARVAGGPMNPSPSTRAAALRALPATLRGGVTEISTSFEAAMSVLGDALIPEPLRRRLTTAPCTRLVVSIPPGFPWLPLPLIGIPDSGGRCLLENATLSLMPPTPIAARLPYGGPSDSRIEPPALAVIDPLGDLDDTSRLPEHTVVLGSRASRASPAALRQALQNIDVRSTFLYRGHVDVVDSGEPLSAALALATDATPTMDDQPRIAHLTAHDILTDEDWTFPSTVILDGCESTGIWGSVEWGGLVPAILSRGARRVISTLWPVMDHPGSNHMTDALWAADVPPASALADVQREQLDLWRTDSSQGGPSLFGSYVLTGAD